MKGEPVPLVVCGLFRSGTNYCRQLAEKNFLVSDPGYYKHAHGKVVDSWSRDVSLVHVYKSPVQWVDSLVRNSYDLCDCYDVAWESGCTEIEIGYGLDGDDWRLPTTAVPVSLEKVMAVHDEYWKFWEKLYDWPGGRVVFPHWQVVAAPAGFLLELEVVLGLETILEDYEFDVGDVKGSPPFRKKLYRYTDTYEMLTDEQALRVNELVSPEVKEYLTWPRRRR